PCLVMGGKTLIFPSLFTSTFINTLKAVGMLGSDIPYLERCVYRFSRQLGCFSVKPYIFLNVCAQQGANKKSCFPHVSSTISSITALLLLYILLPVDR